MSNVVEFPTTDRPITESEIDKLHSEAFRDFEPGICDCTTMAKIAAQMMFAKDDGTNSTGGGIASGWRHTLGGCEGDNNGAAGSRGPTSSGHIWRAMLAAHNDRVERLCRRMQK